MGQVKNHSKAKNNYPSGDSSGRQTYLSLLPRAISSGIIRLFSKTSGLSFISSDFIKRFGTSLAIFSSAFFIALLASSSLAPVQNSDAAQVIQTSIDDSGYYANVSASDIVNLNLVTTPDGATVVGKDTITTETSSPTGFKLYISTNSTTATSSRMTHTNGENYIPTVSGTINNPTKLDMNTWGYALTSMSQNGATSSSAGTVTASSYFIGMPLLNSENLIQNYTESAPTGSGASVDVYFGARANTAIPAGTYTSTVVYTVLAEGSPAYNGEVSVSPTSSLMTGGSTLTIATGVYTNANDLGTVTVSVGGQTCANPIATRANSSSPVTITCTLPDLSSQSVGWKKVNVSMSKFGKSYALAEGVKYYIPWVNLTKMQDMTDLACNEATEATSSNYASVQKVLTDTRDGNTYTVRKLKDGNCWMTENLRLIFNGGLVEHSTTHELFGLTSDNSDFTTLTSWDGGGHTTETSAYHTVWYSSLSNLGNLSKSFTFGSEKSTYDDTNQYKGAVYNWYTATAGTGWFGIDAGTSTQNSICPKNWRLPLGTQENKSWSNLFSGSVTNAMARTAPYSLIRIGNYRGDTAYGTTTNTYVGYYWSATSYDTSGAYYVDLNPNGNDITVQGAALGWGFSVRCVSK